MKRLLVFLIVLAFAGPALAQGVQVQYVRQAKNTALQIFNAVSTATATSSVYDFSAFNGVQLTVTGTGGCSTAQVNVFGGMLATSVTIPSNDPNAFRAVIAATVTYAVVETLPYVMFTISGNDCATVTVYAVPVPFPSSARVGGGQATGATLRGDSWPVHVGGLTSTNVIETMAVDIGGSPIVVGKGAAGAPAGGVMSVQGVGGGTALPISGTVTATTALPYAQESTTSGQTGSMVMGATTTDQPTYTTARTDYLSLATNGGLRVTSTNTSTKETPASASPITVSGNNTVILNANASRHTASLQNSGTAAAFCCLHASTCSSAAYDFALGFPGGASGAGAMSTSFSIGPQPTVWSGGVTCGSTAATIIVGAY